MNHCPIPDEPIIASGLSNELNWWRIDWHAHDYLLCYDLYDMKGSSRQAEPGRLDGYGDIKWDGCHNFTWGRWDGMRVHSCGPKDLVNIERVLYKLAKEHISHEMIDG